MFCFVQSQFLLSLQAISIMVHFYMGTKGPENVSCRLSLLPAQQAALITSMASPQPQVEVLSEEEGEEEDEEEDILSLAEEKYRPAALEKMIALIALLVEQSRSERCVRKPDCQPEGALTRHCAGGSDMM